ncbi:FapA family protein [Desulfatitalea alkaliphila]|uniref:FapA family protein n=1 Tax=Desulfatitalea alkaliphila TaxID=2929485 RepID=A0AA41R1M1_9BACT|nr:FapA family protein [Desulfatitalea alkaliphila]MCJ8499121.1 FapA family protein [Desulfatitalea alkaliphila]
MTETMDQDRLFGDKAIENGLISEAKFQRALVLQRVIAKRSKVQMPIGAVLVKMDLLSQEQVDAINGTATENVTAETDTSPSVDDLLCPLTLTVAPDKLSATLEPFEEHQPPPGLASVQLLLQEKGIVHGVIEQPLMEAYLGQNPLPMAPFVVAEGTPCEPGHPPDIQYHFDTDPMRIGTLLADGTMDWKNRGDIPQVVAGDLLAEKVGGAPGNPGTNVYGQTVPPPRVKDPPLKATKGAERSEDGRRILAKINGTPKLGLDGRIGVFAILPIDTDIGIETGHVDFDGHIDVNGGVESGYQVKGRSLSTREIQSAQIDIEENLFSQGGIYNSTVQVGGNLKASHIHNSTVEVAGDLVVERELFGCTIEVNGRCLIDSGKIIASRISAKKGIQVKDVGTIAARPSELTVGVDFKFAKDMQALKTSLTELETRKAEAETTIAQLGERVDALASELGQVAQEQDGCMVQKRQLEAKRQQPAIAANPEKSGLLTELIDDLGVKYEAMDAQVHSIMELDDQLRAQIDQARQAVLTAEKQMQEIQQEMEDLREAAEVDSGIPVVKVSGTIFAKTRIAGPHRSIVIEQDMQRVRIAESQEDAKEFAMKVSSLR